jgi:hypothetical protein
VSDLLSCFKKDDAPSKRWLERHLDHQDREFCLIWPLTRAQNGYPICGTNGAIRPHRVMCEYRNGPAPSPQHQAAHSCSKGHLGCVNPWHLSWKTPAENQFDRPDRIGRSQRKLRPDQVDEIRKMKGRERTVDTAARFCVTEANIRQIQEGKIWRLDSPRRVFTDDEVRRIRAAPGGVGVVKGFAAEFGVSLSCIHNIRSGRFYKHVSTDAPSHQKRA